MFGWDPTTTATVVLAIVAALALIANAVLAWFTAMSARAARDQVEVERKQLELLGRQLDVTEKQLTASLAAARPRLSATVSAVGDLFANGHVRYVHGTEPAEHVEVWIRTRARLLTAHAGDLTPGSREAAFMASEILDFGAPGIPEFQVGDAVKDDRHVLVAVTWRRVDGERQQSAPALVDTSQLGTLV